MSGITDRNLSPPSDVLDPEAMTERLRAALVPAGVVGRWRVVGVEVVQDEPEQRCAMAYTVEGSWGRRRLFCRFVGGTGATELERLKALSTWLDDGHRRVPEPLAYVPDRNMLISEFVEGRSLAAPLYAGQDDSPAIRMAETTARLHAYAVGETESRDGQDEVRRTAEWEDGLVETGMRDRFRLLLARLGRHPVHGESNGACTIHGRLSPERFRDDNGKTVLLLSGTLTAGDPAGDLGHFLAFLTVRAFQLPRSRSGCLRGRPVFLQAYAQAGGRAAGPRFGERLRFYEACSLLRLAGMYGTRERWMSELPPRLLDAAEALLDGGTR